MKSAGTCQGLSGMNNPVDLHTNGTGPLLIHLQVPDESTEVASVEGQHRQLDSKQFRSQVVPACSVLCDKGDFDVIFCGR